MKSSIILIVVTLGISLNLASAQGKYAQDPGEIAFDGYDLVGYFDNKAVKGSADFELEYDGLTLRFSSQENLEAFTESPETYFPAYGGWCAIAMVDDTFVIPDYGLFKIQDDRLLFFQVKAFFNGLTHWNKDPDKNVVLADSNYGKHFND